MGGLSEFLNPLSFNFDITFDSIDNYQKAIKIIELMAQEFKILGEYKDQKL